jgi:hypothetical protein
MLDKAIYDLRINHGRYITKDEIWELILPRNNDLEEEDENGYIFGKYYLKRTSIFLSSENRGKKLDERLLINQFGNKIKLFVKIFGIEETEGLIFKKNR